ncbi:MAG: class I SAM-dependent methyltransferase [Candidatus Thorarchaeota archaeon]|jgi:hypothetical protein
MAWGRPNPNHDYTKVKRVNGPKSSELEDAYMGFAEELRQTNKFERHLLGRTAVKAGGNIANLGCWLGGSALCMAWYLKIHKVDGRIYTVDTYNNRRLNKKPPYQKDRAKESWAKAGVTDRIKQCVGDTDVWAKKLSHLKFNFVFIDASHKYEWVKKDWECWSLLIPEGGYVGFHDLQDKNVHKVVKNIGKNWELQEHVHSLQVYKRNV